MLIFRIINKRDEEKMEQKSRFECGFNSITSTKNLFSTNFIIMIILFLVFDIEVAVLIPMTLTGATSLKESIVPVVFFIALTTLLIKEWKAGAIEWA